MDIPPLLPSLEIPRTPTELAHYVADLFKAINCSQAEKHAARLRTGYYKYLIRELYPISIFAKWKHPEDDVLYIPQIGNQGFDAKITSLDGKLLGAIEVTWPTDGLKDNRNARELNDRGYTEIEVNNASDGRSDIIERVIQAAVRKATNDYNGTFLLIILDLLPAFFADQPDCLHDIELLKKRLRDVNYRASSVFLLLWPPEYSLEYFDTPIVQIK